MEEYMNSVISQLSSVAIDSDYITYDFNKKVVYNNYSYFKACKDINLSPYKALLFFNDYLNKDFELSHNWQQTDIGAKLQANTEMQEDERDKLYE